MPILIMIQTINLDLMPNACQVLYYFVFSIVDRYILEKAISMSSDEKLHSNSCSFIKLECSGRFQKQRSPVRAQSSARFLNFSVDKRQKRPQTAHFKRNRPHKMYFSLFWSFNW